MEHHVLNNTHIYNFYIETKILYLIKSINSNNNFQNM